MPTIPIYITEDQYKELVALAIHEKQKVSELLQTLVADYLKREGVEE